MDAESASHTQINQLSASTLHGRLSHLLIPLALRSMLLSEVFLLAGGGMKVKIVLAAAMWQNPHVLILDEPLGGKKSQMGVKTC